MFEQKRHNLTRKDVVICCICGALIGIVNGFFGGGGGMICVPLLSKVLRFPKKVAHASAIAIIFPLSFVSCLVYSFNVSTNVLTLFSICFGVLIGGIFGAFLLKILPEKIVGFIFVFVMLFGGFKMIF